MNKIKVPAIKDKLRENPYETTKLILKQAFPDAENPQLHDYNGVNFKTLHSGGFHLVFKGISIKSGEYKNELRKRVLMDKDGMIDLDAIKSKYEECKVHADEVKVLQASRSREVELAGNTYVRILKDMGILEMWKANMSPYTENEVKIYGRTNWKGIQKIQELTGQDIEVKIDINVTADKAVEVYRILYPEVIE